MAIMFKSVTGLQEIFLLRIKAFDLFTSSTLGHEWGFIYHDDSDYSDSFFGFTANWTKDAWITERRVLHESPKETG